MLWASWQWTVRHIRASESQELAEHRGSACRPEVKTVLPCAPDFRPRDRWAPGKRAVARSASATARCQGARSPRSTRRALRRSEPARAAEAQPGSKVEGVLLEVVSSRRTRRIGPACELVRACPAR